MLSHDYHIFRVNSLKKYSLRVHINTDSKIILLIIKIVWRMIKPIARTLNFFAALLIMLDLSYIIF